MKHHLTLLICLTCAAALHGQALRSSGAVPADLQMSVWQLYDSDIQRAEQYAGKRVRNKQQILEASYHINRMLASGHIVYGDPISTLASRIADTLLKDHPALRSELRFYTVTSPGVNAFTTPQGMIFINTGLVAQLDNEAQLAFVIAHEIIHYYRAHGMETLVGNNKRGKKNRDNDLDVEADRAGTLLRHHARSREMEYEADSLGITLFYAASPYWKGVTESVFDILQFGDLPFDDLPFDTTFFNTPYYQLNGCWLDHTAPVTATDDYDDSELTHPNIISRRQRAERILTANNSSPLLAQSVKYLISTPDEFSALRHTARLECIRQDLLHGRYPRAFYNSWILLTEQDSSTTGNTPVSRQAATADGTTQRYLAQALYSIAVAKCNEHEYNEFDDYHRIQGESQQVYYAFHTMNTEQATLAALHKVWEFHMQHPTDSHLTAMAFHLMDLLRHPIGKSPSDFIATPPDTTKNDTTASSQPNTSTTKLTKYERIKLKRQQQALRNTSVHILADLAMADSTLFPTLYNHLSATSHDRQKENTSSPLPANTTDTNAMILYNPSYWIMDKDNHLIADRSCKHEEWLSQRIEQTIQYLGGSTFDFSDQGMHNMTTAGQYNDFLTVCEWMNEFWLTKGSFQHHRIMQPAMDSLLSRLGSNKLTTAVILNHEGMKGSVHPAYAIMLPFIPVVVSAALTGLEHTTMVALVVDAHRGRILTRQAHKFKVADHSALTDAMLYDTYIQSGIRGGAKKANGSSPIGFMGRRVGLMAGANLGMSGLQTFHNPDYTKLINRSRTHILALTPWASVELAVGRRTTLALSARYHSAYSDITHTHRVPRQTPYGYTMIDSIAPGSRNMLTLGLEVRRYKNTDFAPLGYYFDFGAHMVHFTTLTSQNDGNTFGIHFGLGRNYIFAGRLMLNYQIDYAYTYGLHKVFGFIDDTLPYQHYADAVLSNILTIKLGIGFIPF